MRKSIRNAYKRAIPYYSTYYYSDCVVLSYLAHEENIAMNWRELQNFLLNYDHEFLWGRCPACGENVLQAVAYQHIQEEHPEIFENIKQAVERGKMRNRL